MIDTKNILNKYQDLVVNIGRAAASTLYPMEFEYYLCALELTTYEGETIEYFCWPIMPSSITKNESNRTQIKKTYSGVTVIDSKSYTPTEISLKGNFGRSFKILIDSGLPTLFKAFRFSIKNGINNNSDLDQSKLTQNPIQFEVAIKTGFGCVSILRSIINKASGTDDKGHPFKLFFYNPSLGESYLVVPSPGNPLVISLNDSNNNMIHQYSLNLTAIAPISGHTLQGNNSSNVDILSPDIVQKSVSTFVSIVRTSL